MILGLFFSALALAPFDRDGAIALAREGKFVEALVAAEAEPDPARRAEAVIYTRLHAGDLDGALSVGRTARIGGYSSAWLEEREAFAALTVRDAASARAALDALAARPDGGGPGIQEIAARWGAELDTLTTTLAERARASTRARITAITGTILAFAAAALLALTRDRARRSP